MAEAAIPDHRACSRPARKRHVRQAQTRRTQAVTPCTQAVAPCTQAVAPCTQAVAPCTQAVAPCIQAAVHAADETAQQGHVARQVARRSEDQRPADPHQERTCMGTRRIMQVLCGAVWCTCQRCACAAHAHCTCTRCGNAPCGGAPVPRMLHFHAALVLAAAANISSAPCAPRISSPSSYPPEIPPPSPPRARHGTSAPAAVRWPSADT